MERFMYKVPEKQIKDQLLRASHGGTKLVSVLSTYYGIKLQHAVDCS
jgi:hypothetical protein